MENPRQIVNLFLSTKHKPDTLKSELFRAAEAAEEIGMTYMEAAFQLGEHAKEEGLSEEDSDATIRPLTPRTSVPANAKVFLKKTPKRKIPRRTSQQFKPPLKRHRLPSSREPFP